MLAIKPPEAQNEAAPCSLPGGGQGVSEGTGHNFWPSILTTLGMGNLVVVCFVFLWEFLHFHLSEKQMEGKEKKKKKQAGEGRFILLWNSQSLRLNLQQVVG